MVMVQVAIFGLITVGILLLAVLISSAGDNKNNSFKQAVHNQNLYNEMQMNFLLNSVETDLTNQRIEEQVSFEIQYPQGLNKYDDTALDMFAHNNIQIPVEIMEKLSYNNSSSTEEAIKFINIQRQNMIKELQMKMV
jgi:hypothetical protein